jgi:hypothetical protein
MINIRFPTGFIQWSIKPEILDRMPENATYGLVWDADKADGTCWFSVEIDDTNLTSEQLDEVYQLVLHGIK